MDATITVTLNIDDDIRKRLFRFARKASVGECVLTIGPHDKVKVDRITKVQMRALAGHT